MSGTLLPYPRLRAFNAAGLPVPGARLYAYRAGTQQLADTFTTSALDVPHQNPQIADAAGEFRALYMDPESGYSYKFVCQTAAGAQLWAEDNVPAAPGTVGSQGPPGSAGTPGLSVAELSIYQRAASAPATPSGGSFDFGTQTLDPPAGWSVTIPADSSEPCWVSLAVAAADRNFKRRVHAKAIRVKGDVSSRTLLPAALARQLWPPRDPIGAPRGR